MDMISIVTWNNGVCETTSGIRVYADTNLTQVSQEQCTGYALQENSAALLLSPIGSGIMEYQMQTLDANDKSYRYNGANPNNYVCFGSNEVDCLYNNLYRIIGVFDGQVKLIKVDYATSAELGTNGDYSSITYSSSDIDTYKGNLTTINRYYWNDVNHILAYQETGYINVWSYSELNKTNLNTNFLNSFDSVWQNMIATVEWKVGGIGDDAYVSNFNKFYDYEIKKLNVDVETTYTARIGLMYVSDYIYGAIQEDWNTPVSGYVLGDGATPNDNWIYMGLEDWTISRNIEDGETIWFISGNGLVARGTYSFNAIRPVFYISSSALYSSGDGSINNPFRIEI